MTKYFAHSPGENGTDWHKLSDHLIDVAKLAANYASEFNAADMAYLAGLLHDLGKYSEKFQSRLRGSNEKVDHSTAGARMIRELAGNNGTDRIAAELISYAIAGHHAGLADFDKLEGRLGKVIEPLNEVWQAELNADVERIWPANLSPDENNIPFQFAFLGRMIFSCLVDADYKDTERFYAEQGQKVADREWPCLRSNIETLISRFEKFINEKREQAPDNEVNRLRSDILHHVRNQAGQSPGLFTLTVPTGGGKTLTSLGFALDHARANNLRRIIYAIPFTSIIDQNAEVFRHVIGDEFILEHHSSIDETRFKDPQQWDKLKLAMEDWAAPIVVTTNVQLFESLFANRPAKCRKLHNMSNSVIILDEVQTLPGKLLCPCLAALDELARNYGSTIILCTATQPAFDKRNLKHNGLDLEGRELAPDPTSLNQKLKRTTISKGHELDDDALVEELCDHEQGLVIVNTRKHAMELYNNAKDRGLEGVVHLSTRQYALHRKEILAQIRVDLENERACRVIATSLVEAGVDLDFPRVWRAETGLDQIAQAAGRCNREGKRPVEESIVKIFKPVDNPPPGELAQLASDFWRMADKYDDLLSPEAIKEFFLEVYWRKGADQLDAKEILREFSVSGTRVQMNYQQVARKFQMIESGMTPVIINDGNERVQEIIGRLQNSEASPGKAARELQPFIVQVPPLAAAALKQYSRAEYIREDLWGDQFLAMGDRSLYRPDIGLLWEDATFQGIQDLFF